MPPAVGLRWIYGHCALATIPLHSATFVGQLKYPPPPGRLSHLLFSSPCPPITVSPGLRWLAFAQPLSRHRYASLVWFSASSRRRFAKKGFHPPRSPLLQSAWRSLA